MSEKKVDLFKEVLELSTHIRTVEDKQPAREATDENLKLSFTPMSAEKQVPKQAQEAKGFDLEGLLGISDGEMRKLLQRVAPDDLVAACIRVSKALRSKILNNLDSKSAKWLQQNIEAMGEITNNLWDSARQKIAKAVHELRLSGTGGEIKDKKSNETENATRGEVRVKQSEMRAKPSEKGDESELAGTFVDLLQVVGERGPQALQAVVSEVEEPLLRFGLQLILDETEPGRLEVALERAQAELEAKYHHQLSLIRQGVLAIRRGDSPEEFRQRVR